MEMVEHNNPDIMIILESALTDKIKPHTCHDNYEIVLNNSTKELDLLHSKGRGILVLARKGLRVEKIFPLVNGDRTALMIC